MMSKRNNLFVKICANKFIINYDVLKSHDSDFIIIGNDMDTEIIKVYGFVSQKKEYIDLEILLKNKILGTKFETIKVKICPICDLKCQNRHDINTWHDTICCVCSSIIDNKCELFNMRLPISMYFNNKFEENKSDTNYNLYISSKSEFGSEKLIFFEECKYKCKRNKKKSKQGLFTRKQRRYY